MNKGQGLVEYAIVIVLVIAVIVIVIALFGQVLTGVNQCSDSKDMSFKCRDYQLQQCIKSEKYSQDECMALVGGK